MFELPKGEPIDESTDISVGAMQMPFDYGVISHYSGRRKTPIAHRLVCDGLVVGWLAEGDDKNVYVGGMAARSKLVQISNSAKVRSTGSSWQRSDFASVVSMLPEAFPDTSKLGALMPGSTEIYTLEPADISSLAKDLSERPAVMGAIALEDGSVQRQSCDDMRYAVCKEMG